LLYIQRCR